MHISNFTIRISRSRMSSAKCLKPHYSNDCNTQRWDEVNIQMRQSADYYIFNYSLVILSRLVWLVERFRQQMVRVSHATLSRAFAMALHFQTSQP